ncbi:hypothetical protein Ahy_A04g018704 [Arachis hypogaea]|uniref:Replication protein A 70 kDa DNA-binding subunit B/D first OB fold domain-containing protein n=1 Tax=Arachis hypogaea TaxID=3818 RepID=A0A445DEF8_ARAHY|nr:hypothetical protein Ahy_A04g018704 [Arachis hypogaea]
MVESYDFVKDVNAKKLAWSFKVHIVRIWEIPNKFNLKEPNSIEMGGRIQASIPKSLVKKWRGVIIEFQMYTISNFIVIKKTNPIKRVTPGTWVLTFSHRTRVDHVVNLSFPLQPFRFKTIPQLINAESSVDNDLFDLIGEIVGKEDLKDLITNKGKETRRLAVVLQDLEYVH